MDRRDEVRTPLVGMILLDMGGSLHRGTGITQAMQSEVDDVLLCIPKNRYYSSRYNEISMTEVHFSEI